MRKLPEVILSGAIRSGAVGRSLAAVVAFALLCGSASAARQPSPGERAGITQAVVFLFGYYRGPMTPRVVSINVSTVGAPGKFALESFRWVEQGHDFGIARVLLAYSRRAVTSAYPHFGIRAVHWVLEGAQILGSTAQPCPSAGAVDAGVLRDLGLRCR